jgi:glycosyltransferase involved in cell wall biosynthesis
MTKVDVVVPCYNYGSFLETCVRSVLDQSISDVRVLIIDDASSDNSVSKANDLARSDCRVSVISHSKNCGHIATYNEGIAWASADYFLLLSADDLLVPGALQRATRIMDEHPDIVLTHGKHIIWQDNLPVPKVPPEPSYRWTRHNLILETCDTGYNLVATAGAIARTRVQKAIGGYRPYLPHSGDLEMWLRFCSQGVVARIDAVQCIYRKHSSNMSIEYQRSKLPDYQQRKAAFDSFFEQNGNSIPGSKALREKANRAIAEQAYWTGVGQLLRGNTSSSRQLFGFSFSLSPKLRFCPPMAQLTKSPNLRKNLTSILGQAIGKFRVHPRQK